MVEDEEEEGTSVGRGLVQNGEIGLNVFGRIGLELEVGVGDPEPERTGEWSSDGGGARGSGEDEGRRGRSEMGTVVRYCLAARPARWSGGWLARGRERWISLSSRRSLCERKLRLG